MSKPAVSWEKKKEPLQFLEHQFPIHQQIQELGNLSSSFVLLLGVRKLKMYSKFEMLSQSVT